MLSVVRQQGVMTNDLMLATVRCLFDMAREDRPAELGRLASRLALSCRQTDAILHELERAGLADAERVRLTMPGLAVAVALPEGLHQKVTARRRPPRAA